MAKRVVGLIGKGAGPRVFVGGIATVEVLGAEEGHSVRVIEWGREGTQRFFHVGNGKHEAGDCHYLQFEYSGPGRKLICNVHMET
jgi:hypothetical protein